MEKSNQEIVYTACENYPEWEQTIRNLFFYLDVVAPGYKIDGIYGRPLEFHVTLPEDMPDRLYDEAVAYIESVEAMCLM